MSNVQSCAHTSPDRRSNAAHCVNTATMERASRIILFKKSLQESRGFAPRDKFLPKIPNLDDFKSSYANISIPIMLKFAQERGLTRIS